MCVSELDRRSSFLSVVHHRRNLCLQFCVAHLGALRLLVFFSKERDLFLLDDVCDTAGLGASPTMEANIPCPLYRTNYRSSRIDSENTAELDSSLVLVEHSLCGGEGDLLIGIS